MSTSLVHYVYTYALYQVHFSPHCGSIIYLSATHSFSPSPKFKMKQLGFKSFLLLVALQHIGVESRTWQSRSFVHPSLRSQHSFALPIRGGDQPSDVPIVPEDTIYHDVQQGVCRGGSTKTDKYPRGVSVSTLTATSVVTPVSPAAENVTSLETLVSHPVKPAKKDKRHKRHKQIAKKLKVRTFCVEKRFGFLVVQ
jgi:hypothetical protein